MNTVLAITVLALAIALAAVALAFKRKSLELEDLENRVEEIERVLSPRDEIVPPSVDPRDLVRRAMQDHLTTHHRNDR